MKRKYFLVGLFLMLVMFLVGCNGNGGSTPPITLNQSPTASFNADPTSGAAPLEVYFNASSSSDSDGSIIIYTWNFKDGDTGTGETINHTFNSIGSYIVELTVIDNEGATDSTTKTIMVNQILNQSPTASFTANPTSGVAPLEVSFNASSSSDSDGSIIIYTWNFKDGDTGNGETISHTFSSAGSYTVSLIITDNDGAADTTTKNITVTEPSIEPVSLGTPLTKDGITVTIESIVVVEPPLCPDPAGIEIYFSVINNSEQVLKSGKLGPATGSIYYDLDEEIYEDEFNSIGYTYIGDCTSWVYPGQSRSVGYRKCFHSPVTINQITWTGTFEDNSEIDLGPWEN